MISQLYVPKSGEPIFQGDARVLVAGYSVVGGTWNPLLCAAGRLLEPWLPEQSAPDHKSMPYFCQNLSTLTGIEQLRGDTVRVVRPHPSEENGRTVAAIIRAGQIKDCDGMRMYVLTEDLEGIGVKMATFLQQYHHDLRRRDMPLSHAQLCEEFTQFTLRISAVMSEVRRQTDLRHAGFML